MITFWLLAALLIAAALAFLLPPLLAKGNSKPDAISRDAVNIAILRNQLSELDADLDAGTLQPDQYELARNELQKRVLEEATSAAPQLRLESKTGRTPAILLGLTVPALAVGLYFLLGNPQGLTPNAVANNPNDVTQEQIESMVNRLAQRMEKNPSDPAGWAMLARSYSSLGRFTDAATAYGKLSALTPNDADVLIEWADTQAMAQGRSLDGEPEKLILRALAINPNHPKGLALAGSIAYIHKDYAGALKNWRHMMTLVEPDSQLAQAIAPGIAQAQTLAGSAQPASLSNMSKRAANLTAVTNAKATLTGRVELDPALRSQVSDSDAVFIFVRAAQGPRMPIVALRKQVRDLPLNFSFDDTTSLSPDRKLSAVPSVIVGARISKSGDAMPQPGDIQTLSATLSHSAKDVRLRLTRP